jgi:hypothetical protein
MNFAVPQDLSCLPGRNMNFAVPQDLSCLPGRNMNFAVPQDLSCLSGRKMNPLRGQVFAVRTALWYCSAKTTPAAKILRSTARHVLPAPVPQAQVSSSKDSSCERQMGCQSTRNVNIAVLKLCIFIVRIIC